MGTGLTELGLKRSPAAAADPRADHLARFLARLIEVVAEFAPRSDGSDLEAFRRTLHGYRELALDPRRDHELEGAVEQCVAACTAYFKASRTYGLEREHELTELVSVLQDAARISVGESKDFHSQVLASSQRFETIAQLDDIRDLRRRLGDEVSSLRRAVIEKQQREEEAFAKLTQRVETLQTRLQELELEVTVDALTKVANRGYFDRALTQMLGAATRGGTPLALAMIDVDHFKQINDTHGHPIGDRVLLCLAQKLTRGVRGADVVSRYGGEEFAVLLPGTAAADVEERFRTLIGEIAASAFTYEALGESQRVRFTVSCGLADLQPNDTEADLVARADDALYEAKRQGRNRLVTRKPSLFQRILRKHA